MAANLPAAGRRAATAVVQLGLPELPAEARDYAAFDLETTGLHAGSCQIIEVGWVVVRDAVVGRGRSLLVRCDAGVSAEVQALTGITPDLLAREGVPLAEALSVFLAETDGLLLVGHNVLRFDVFFLEAACRQVGQPAPARSRYRDTAALYKAQRLGLSPRDGQDHWSFAAEALDRRAPGLRYKLAICCDALGIARDGLGLHRAAADAVLAQRLYQRLVTGES